MRSELFSNMHLGRWTTDRSVYNDWPTILHTLDIVGWTCKGQRQCTEDTFQGRLFPDLERLGLSWEHHFGGCHCEKRVLL